MGFRVGEIVLVVLFLEPCLVGVTEVLWEMPCLQADLREKKELKSFLDHKFRSRFQGISGAH